MWQLPSLETLQTFISNLFLLQGFIYTDSHRHRDNTTGTNQSYNYNLGIVNLTMLQYSIFVSSLSLCEKGVDKILLHMPTVHVFRPGICRLKILLLTHHPILATDKYLSNQETGYSGSKTNTPCSITAAFEQSHTNVILEYDEVAALVHYNHYNIVEVFCCRTCPTFAIKYLNLFKCILQTYHRMGKSREVK